MGRRHRPRSSSSIGGTPKETSGSSKSSGCQKNVVEGSSIEGITVKEEHARRLLRCIASHRDGASGKNFLHQCAAGGEKKNRGWLPLAAGLCERAKQLDHRLKSNAPGCDDNSSGGGGVLRDLMLAADEESGYTALHWSVFRGDLATLLLFLRFASWADSDDDLSSSLSRRRMQQRPMHLLQGILLKASSACFASSSSTLSSSGGTTSLLRSVVSAKDHEGYTAGDLLAALQQKELLACRLSLYRPRILTAGVSERTRHGSFDELLLGHGQQEVEQNEFDLLSRTLQQLQAVHERSRSSSSTSSSSSDSSDLTSGWSYGCEVVTFGRAHHCALGVGGTTNSCGGGGNSAGVAGVSSGTNPKIRPQRLETFAQSVVGRPGGAVAIAAAAHHTLAVTSSGQVYACGLGKGGRLGTGSEAHCPLPTRVLGPLTTRHVVAVAAAENHSLVVTKAGSVYSWGSNRFGQLGMTTAAPSSSGGNTATGSCLPRRIDDLKHVMCVSVAAGSRHSVALSKSGEVYAWGDNAAGQLGISRRSGTHKAQRVEALWGSSSSRRPGIAIAASEQRTLVLTIPTGTGLPVNSIYEWGHGSHVPSKVQFPQPQSNATTTMGTNGNSNRLISPVAIACARYHSVAITSDGLVYTWGLHAETLGTGPGNTKTSKVTTNTKKSAYCATGASAPSSMIITSPQLVTGMLPENGGGIAVAASASENHTAIITDRGALFTWGATFGQNILGHEGVRWQPEPRQVPGVHRAVGVAAAKEHTVVLIGASFPPITVPPEPFLSLETLAARKIAEHVDLFNVLPILIMAERTHCSYLIEYCMSFLRRNLDGALNVAQKSVMDCYLDEQLVSRVLRAEGEDDHREGCAHPLVLDVVNAGGTSDSLLFEREALCNMEDWLSACEDLSQDPRVAAMILRFGSESTKTSSDTVCQRQRKRSSSFSDSSSLAIDLGSPKSATESREQVQCSERCLMLTTKMDLSTMELSEAKHGHISKEIRGIRKRLSQIGRLEESVAADASFVLSSDQRDKVARRPQLEADLLLYEPAIEVVGRRMQEFNDDMATKQAPAMNDTPKDKDVKAKEVSVVVCCKICNISCPDGKSYELHMNGRKHRNRVAQVAEEERRIAAAAMMEERHRQQVARPSVRPAVAQKARKDVNPWKSEKAKPLSQPKFNLPPPPHATPDAMVEPAGVSSPSQKKSLLEIMEDEKNKLQETPKTSTSVSFSLKLPPGSAPAMQSPPWAKPVARVAVAAPGLSDSSTPACSLGAFVLPETPAKATSPRVFGWGSPNPQKSAQQVSPVSQKPQSSMSFTEIQEQEREKKEKQDQSCSVSGKWYIQQRERASSLKEIQSSAAQEREERLFLEEQFRIEKQIEDELALKKAQEARKGGTNRRRRGDTKRRKPKSSGEHQGRKKTEGAKKNGGNKQAKDCQGKNQKVGGNGKRVKTDE